RPVASAARTISSIAPAVRCPFASTALVASWMTGPSIIGSLNGMPISSTPPPASAAAAAMSTNVSPSGYPHTRNGITNAFVRSANASSRRCAGVTSVRAIACLHDRAHGLHVFVSATAEVHDRDGVGAERARLARDPRDRVRRLQRRKDPFGAREQAERVERFVVSGRLVRRETSLAKVRVLGTHARVVEARGDRVRRSDLAVRILD